MGGKVRALGVWFYINYCEESKKNYEEKVHKVEEIVSKFGETRD